MRHLLAGVSPVHPIGLLLLFPAVVVWAGRQYGSRGVAMVSGLACVTTLALPFLLRSSRDDGKPRRHGPPLVTCLVGVLVMTAVWFGGLMLALALFGVAASVA